MALDTPGIPTRALIYCRISRDREGAGLGVERQREDCEALAKQLGIEIVAVYSDNDMSAYSGKPRPGYKQLLDDLREGRADTVLSWHTDRLHRSPAELEEYIDVCEPRRVQTRTVKAGHLDLTTATGRMIARQLGVQARYEVERMVERQKRTRDQMAEQGKHFGGRRPFGYEEDRVTPRALVCGSCGAEDGFRIVQRCPECRTDSAFAPGRVCGSCDTADGVTVLAVCACGGDTSVVEGSEAWHVAWAASALLSGTSLRAVAAEWNSRGVLTSTGGTWAPTEVRSMMVRPRNAGIIRHRGQEAGPARWPALLDEGTWRSVVALLSDPARRTTPGSERKHLGTGLYECGQCSAPVRIVTSNKNGAKYATAYACRVDKTHVVRKVGPVDAYVVLNVTERLAEPGMADLLAAREDPVDVRGAQRDMRLARETLDTLAAEFGAGEMDVQEWRTARKAARERLENAQKLLERAVEVNPVAGLVGAEDVNAAWDALSLSRRRAVISYLMTVRLFPGKKGRLPGGTYFDRDSVRIEWK
ncbi:recombinase family protein [Streptomyces parvulus]|uniref:recombinase family protein n=1 Tax=Streptomyces parvulus TaxID=146923 RepID=UPI003326419A